jgi:hypothetical protein
MRFILDYILFAHEKFKWANHTNQSLNSLKLGLSKANNMVDLNFLLGAMNKFNFPHEFTWITKILFKHITIFVKINGTHTISFIIKCKVMQECLFPPRFFVIVMKLMNTMIKLKLNWGL